MKHLKFFESYNQNDGLTPSAREIFDIWNVIIDKGYAIEKFDINMDWEMGEELDRPDDHVVTYSVNAIDSDGIEWETSEDYVDGHGDGPNFEYIELSFDGEKTMEKKVLDIIKEADPHAIMERMEIDSRRKLVIKTSLEWNEFVGLFKKIEKNQDDQFECELKLMYESLDGGNHLDLYYRRSKGSIGYFSL